MTWTLLGVIDFPGITASVPDARRRFQQLIGDTHPALDDAVLLVSELVTNAILHAASAIVTLAVADTGDRLHVDVIDQGSDNEPHICSDLYGVNGRGLFLVDTLSQGWGVHTNSAGRTVWFELKY